MCKTKCINSTVLRNAIRNIANQLTNFIRQFTYTQMIKISSINIIMKYKTKRQFWPKKEFATFEPKEEIKTRANIGYVIMLEKVFMKATNTFDSTNVFNKNDRGKQGTMHSLNRCVQLKQTIINDKKN
jgi:hypothetical protein